MPIDEVLYMQVRVFGQFVERFKMKASDAYALFEENGIWDYIKDGYDVFHMNGDECVLSDIQYILTKRGAMG